MTTFLSLLCLAKNVSEKLLLSRWNLRTLSPPSSTSPSLAPRWRASSYSTTWLRIQLCSRFQIKCRSFSASFSSQGRGADQGGDYQFDIYRSMKQHNQVLIVWMQTFCRQWRSPPNLHLLRTLGPRSGPEAMCCGCIIFSPRFTDKNILHLSTPFFFFYQYLTIDDSCGGGALLKQDKKDVQAS